MNANTFLNEIILYTCRLQIHETEVMKLNVQLHRMLRDMKKSPSQE